MTEALTNSEFVAMYLFVVCMATASYLEVNGKEAGIIWIACSILFIACSLIN